MEPQVTQPIPVSPPLMQPASDNKRKFIILGALVFLAFIIALVVLFFTSQKQSKTSATTPTPTGNPSTSTQTKLPDETKPTLAPSVKWVSYTSTKLQSTSFPSYTISYPETWTRDVENDGVTDSIVLVKGEYSIKIFQAPAEGGQCVFDDPLPTGSPFVQDFRGKQFVEIVTDSGNMRRIPKPSQNTFTNYTFCMRTPTSNGSYGMPTTFGFITYSVPDQEDKSILSEMDQIIKTLKTVK